MRLFTGNTVNTCHIIKMTGNSSIIFRKDKKQSHMGMKLLQGFPLPELDENLRFCHKGRKLETKLTGFQLLRKGINICFFFFSFFFLF